MGVTIQFESHRVELPFIYEAEHDSQVFEYYDQPPSIPLFYRASNGRRLSVMHTPDYFVLREGSACWIECKTEEDLEALASRNPNRYSRDIGGKWRCIPGEEHAATVGLAYEVWSAAQVNWVLQRNLQFLEDYLRFGSANPPDTVNSAVISAIETEPGINLLNLLERTRGVAEPDEIYMLIASGAIYVDLNVAPIAEPEQVRVFATAEIAAACAVVSRASFVGIGVAVSTGGFANRQMYTARHSCSLLRPANRILPLRIAASILSGDISRGIGCRAACRPEHCVSG